MPIKPKLSQLLDLAKMPIKTKIFTDGEIGQKCHKNKNFDRW